MQVFMTKQISHYIFTFLLSLSVLSGYAQQDAMFNMSKLKSGHYAISVAINDTVKANALLESGIHAFLIDSAFAFNNYEKLGLEFTPSTKNINLGGRNYRVTHTADTTLLLGKGATYKGEVFLLADYAKDFEVAVPIQNIQNSNGERLIELDFVNGRLKILANKNLVTKKWTEYKLNTNTYLNMPAVEGSFKFIGDKYEALLDGNFNIDLGNPSLLFLFEHRDRVKDFLNDNPNIKLQKGYDKKGNVIATVFVPEELTFGGIEFKSPIVSLTGFLSRFTTEGCIGLKFFQSTIVVFDFDNSCCYMLKNNNTTQNIN